MVCKDKFKQKTLSYIGLSQCLSETDTPPPQVLEQELHDDHDPHPPSIACAMLP